MRRHTRHLWDGLPPSVRTAASPVAERTTTAGVSGSVVNWITTDIVGTSHVEIMNTTGATTRRYTDPFGKPKGTTSSWSSNHGYLNAPTSSTTGLTHLGAREFDPNLGTFATLDPVLTPTKPQQNNGYSYARNNPVTSSDPTGLEPKGTDGYYDGHYYDAPVRPGTPAAPGNQPGNAPDNTTGRTPQCVSTPYLCSSSKGRDNPTVNPSICESAIQPFSDQSCRLFNAPTGLLMDFAAGEGPAHLIFGSNSWWTQFMSRQPAFRRTRTDVIAQLRTGSYSGAMQGGYKAEAPGLQNKNFVRDLQTAKFWDVGRPAERRPRSACVGNLRPLRNGYERSGSFRHTGLSRLQRDLHGIRGSNRVRRSIRKPEVQLAGRRTGFYNHRGVSLDRDGELLKKRSCVRSLLLPLTLAATFGLSGCVFAGGADRVPVIGDAYGHWIHASKDGSIGELYLADDNTLTITAVPLGLFVSGLSLEAGPMISVSGKCRPPVFSDDGQLPYYFCTIYGNSYFSTRNIRVFIFGSEAHWSTGLEYDPGGEGGTYEFQPKK